jgi:hypothetical protein
VELGEELDEAIELLYRAATRGGGQADALFYLARAHHLNYNFSEALKYYNRFGSVASRQKEKEYRIDYLKSTCRSGMEITSSYNPYEVMNVTFIDLSDSVQFSQIKMKGGGLQYKPERYMDEDEDRNGLAGLMFIPPNAVRGEFAFFAGMGRNRKEGLQLFRIRKGPGNSWGDPEEVRALNSDGDELMPYFDPVENDLYFASDGRLGVGGFDLYKSHYDSERDEWSEPMNLGFPINSVMDEVMLLPGTDLGMLMFFSNRQGPDSMWTVYRVHLIEPKRGADVRDHQLLREIAAMGGVADEIREELEELASESSSPASEDHQPPEVEDETGTDPVLTPVKILAPSASHISYVDIEAEARVHQEKADSLKQLAAGARIRVNESDDPNDKWVWQKQIMLWEKKSNDQQEMADELFSLLAAQQTRNLLAGNPLPETIEPDTVIDGLTVFRYTFSSAVAGEPGTPPEQPEKIVIPAKEINRFQILDQSPYTSHLSVPMDVPLPDGIFYRIQLGVFSGEVGTDVFKGITPITGERMEGRGLVKYYAGKFSRYSDASAALARIQTVGFEDAFIVAWYNGQQVATHRAKQLE